MPRRGSWDAGTDSSRLWVRVSRRTVAGFISTALALQANAGVYLASGREQEAFEERFDSDFKLERCKLDQSGA